MEVLIWIVGNVLIFWGFDIADDNESDPQSTALLTVLALMVWNIYWLMRLVWVFW